MTKRKKHKRLASRTQIRLTLACFLILAGVVVWLDRANVPKPQTPAHNTTADVEKYHGKTFTVIKVIDGDTLDIDIPDGKYQTTRIRLWGVDAPETAKSTAGAMYFGDKASGFSRTAAQNQSVKIILDPNRPTRGKYDRMLAYVQFDDGTVLNELLIVEGLAYADVRFDQKYFDKYLRLERTARDAKAGLWKNLTKDKAPGWVRRIRPELFAPEN